MKEVLTSRSVKKPLKLTEPSKSKQVGWFNWFKIQTVHFSRFGGFKGSKLEIGRLTYITIMNHLYHYQIFTHS